MSVRAAFRRRFDPDERYGLRVTLLAMALLLVAVPFGWLLNQVESNGAMVRRDTALAERLHRWAQESPGAVDMLKAVTFLGSPVWLYAVALAVAGAMWKRGRPRVAVFVVVTAAAGGLLNHAVKLAVNRPRPSLIDPVATASGRSFPSGHAMSSTVVYGCVLLVLVPLVARWLRPLLAAVVAALVAGIAFSRLGLGVHYLSDVAGGVVLGLAWLALSTAAFRAWRQERAPPHGRRVLPPDAAPSPGHLPRAAKTASSASRGRSDRS